MLSNLHTHSTFCDGKNTPEEIVLAAIDAGFCSLGFSGHCYILPETQYCMKDTPGYIAEIKRLQEKYASKLQIYLGIEEDLVLPVQRSDFDYIIGSSHYVCRGETRFPVDSSAELLMQGLALYDNDPIAYAHAYYAPFCSYIERRKPDIVGHFDLLTKFDELDVPFFLENKEYLALSERYMEQAARSGCLFEVNTGAISRGYRTAPYPHENLLLVLKACGSGLVLNSDSHSADTLSCAFAETRRYLLDLGFDSIYTLYDGTFTKVPLRA